MRTLGSLCAVLVCLTTTTVAVGQSLDQGATSSPRILNVGPNVPAWGVAFEAGKDRKQLSGRGAVHYDKMTFDFALTGADYSKSTGRSDLLHSLDAPKGGSVSAGITWHSFDMSASTLPRRVMELCLKQIGERDTEIESKWKQTDAYKLQQQATLDEASAKKLAEGAEGQLDRDNSALEQAAKNLEESVSQYADAEKKGADQLALDALKRKIQESQTAVGLASARHAIVSAKYVVLKDALRKAESARAAADDAAKKQKAELEKAVGKCEYDGDLKTDRRAELRWDGGPSVVLSLRGQVSTQSSDYFDDGLGKVKTDTERPWGTSLGLGVFAHPLLFPAVTIGYQRTRKLGDAGTLCVGAPVAGAQTTPPTYTCTDATIGLPAWKQTTSLRLEVRHYISSGVAWNPSFTYAWSGPEVGLFEQGTGLWQLEVPVYYQLAAGGSSGLAIGLSYLHKKTWGLGSKNNSDDDLIAFLAAGFEIGRLK